MSQGVLGAGPHGGLGTTVQNVPVMDGRRLFEILVVIVGLGIALGTLVWLSWVMTSFSDPR